MTIAYRIGSILLLFCVATEAGAADIPWRTITVSNGAYRTYVRTTNPGFDPGQPLAPPFTGIQGIFFQPQQNAPVLGPLDLKRALALTQTAAHLANNSDPAIISCCILPSGDIRSRSYTDSTGTHVDLWFPAIATDLAADIQLGSGVPLVLPGLTDRPRRRAIYKEILVDAVMQAEPEFVDQVLYLDSQLQQQMAVVPSSASHLAQILPLIDGNVHAVSAVNNILGSGLAYGETTRITYEELHAFFEVIQTDQEVARIVGFRYAHVEFQNTTYKKLPIFDQISDALLALQAARDVAAADAKYAVYHVLAGAQAQARRIRLDEALMNPQIAATLNSLDPAFLDGWSDAKQEIDDYATNVMRGFSDQLAALVPTGMRFLEGKLVAAVLARFGGAVGILAYLGIDAWAEVFDDRAMFQHAACAATASKMLVQAEQTWFSVIQGGLVTQTEEAVDRFCRYGSVRSALGVSYYDRALRYFQPTSLLAQFLNGLGILETPDPTWISGREAFRVQCARAVNNMRPELYRAWTLALFDQTPTDPNETVLEQMSELLVPPAPDCNANGTPDSLDISTGNSFDNNHNQVPDECELPPANDLCLNAVAVGDGVFQGTNVGASTGGGAASCGGGGANDVWWRYTAPSTGNVTINTCGSDFDTVLSVRASCGGADLACDDNGCGLQSSVTLAVTQGTDYFIRVAGKNGATGNITLNTSASSCQAPAAPSWIGATEPPDGLWYCDRILVIWEQIAAANSYQVWRGASSNVATAQPIGTSQTNSLEDYNVAPGTTYYYWVKACNACGCSTLVGGTQALPGHRRPHLPASTPRQPSAIASLFTGTPCRRPRATDSIAAPRTTARALNKSTRLQRALGLISR